MRKLLSIIIPIFNNKQYIEECVQSITHVIGRSGLDQQEYEIIIIDDGSTDGSAEVCDLLAEKYSPLSVKHKKNGGVSQARNTGISLARGEYLIFCDSDDLWDRDAPFDQIVPLIRDGEYDLMFTGRYRGDSSGKIVREYRLEPKKYHGGFDAVSSNNYMTKNICALLIKSSIVERYGLKFIESLKYTEDEVFETQCVWVSDSIIDLDLPYFIYRNNPASATNKMEQDKVKAWLSGVHQKCIFLAQLPLIKSIPHDNQKVTSLYNNMSIGYTIDVIEGYFRYSISVKKLRQWLIENQMDAALFEYESANLGENIKSRFRRFIKHPYAVAFRCRSRWLLRCLTIKLIPEFILCKFKS